MFGGLIIKLVWLVISLHKPFVLAKFYCCVLLLCVCVCVCGGGGGGHSKVDGGF